MAVVKSEQFEAFLQALPRQAELFLLHGSDSDLASERARRLAPKLGDDVVRIGADVLARDPGKLADEASAISMFGDRRVIWVDAGGRDVSALIAAAAETLPAETKILVEADSLKKGAPLRAWFETKPNAVAIECYPAGPESLGLLVDAEARTAGVRLGREARAHLVQTLAADPGAARGEIAKLMLFAQSAGVLEAADIDALAAGAGVSPADGLIDAAFAGEFVALERGVASGLADSADAALAATRLAQRVALLMEIRASGGEPERLHRLPFAAKRAVLAQAQAHSPEALARRLPALLNLLIAARRRPELSGSAAFRALYAFTVAAQRAARR